MFNLLVSKISRAFNDVFIVLFNIHTNRTRYLIRSQVKNFGAGGEIVGLDLLLVCQIEF